MPTVQPGRWFLVGLCALSTLGCPSGVTAFVKLAVVRAGSGSGTVTGGAINCGATCVADVRSGEMVSLIAMASPGSKFTSWSGCDTVSNATCVVQPNADRIVTVSFDTDASGTGGGSGAAGGDGTAGGMATGGGAATAGGATAGGATAGGATAGGATAGGATAGGATAGGATAGGATAGGATAGGATAGGATAGGATAGGATAGGATAGGATAGGGAGGGTVHYDLAVMRLGPGTGTVMGGPISCGLTCTASIPSGTLVTLTATPGVASGFMAWSGCDTTSGTTCTVVVTSMRSVSVTFSALPTAPLTVAKNGTGSGLVAGGPIDCGATCSALVNAGTMVALNATPDAGSTFGSWASCDLTMGSTCIVTVSVPRTVTATFDAMPVSYPVTVIKAGTGSGTVTGGAINCGTVCATNVPEGTMLTLTATPGAGSTFSSWSGCDSVSGAVCTVNVNAARAVTASFATLTVYTLTVTNAGTGSGTVTGGSINCGVTCIQTAASGTMITLTASPAAGSTFVSWAGCTTSSGAMCTVDLTSNRSVIATFDSTSICTVGQTRCVAGSVSSVETCNGTAWTSGTCGSTELCANGRCRAVCGLTATPAFPSVCMVPIQDGVNNGAWWWSSDTRLSNPANATGAVFSTGMTPASIYSDVTQSWPYYWNLTDNGLASIQFKLAGFMAGRTVYLRYRARRSGVTGIGYPSRYVYVWFNNGNPVDSSASAAHVSYLFTTALTSTTAALNYSATLWNTAGLSITGDGLGHAADLLDVNWLLLEVR